VNIVASKKGSDRNHSPKPYSRSDGLRDGERPDVIVLGMDENLAILKNDIHFINRISVIGINGGDRSEVIPVQPCAR